VKTQLKKSLYLNEIENSVTYIHEIRFQQTNKFEIFCSSPEHNKYKNHRIFSSLTVPHLITFVILPIILC